MGETAEMAGIVDGLSDVFMYWKTKDGKVIHISDLTDSHLLNIIAMLRRQAPARRLAEELAIVSGPRPNGEMAQDAFDEEVRILSDRSDEEYLESVPVFHNLLLEARDRKLEV